MGTTEQDKLNPIRQRMMDDVYTALVKQGEVSFDPVEDVCRYRYTKPDGTVLKCAAGHLMPDDMYDEQHEGSVITNVVPRFEDIVKLLAAYLPEDLSTLNETNALLGYKLRAFIREMQIIHDSLYSVTQCEYAEKLSQKFQKMASTFNLEWNH